MSMKSLLSTSAFAAALLAVPAGASAQETGGSAATEPANAQAGTPPPVVPLSDWTYDNIYRNGWSLDELIEDADVVGANGEEIGDIENVMIGADGKILSVIAEVGGFLDIGDTHVSIPWNQVEVSSDLDRIQVPVTEENVEDYSLYGEWGYFTKPEASTTHVVNDDLQTGPRVWKATDLLGDYALLKGNMAYGYVEDLIFTSDGQLHAVVVGADLTRRAGPYALPYYGYGWAPGWPYYTLPYGEEELAVIDTFDPTRVRSRGEDAAAANGEAATTDGQNQGSGAGNSAN